MTVPTANSEEPNVDDNNKIIEKKFISRYKKLN
jgi:hypothetical protein